MATTPRPSLAGFLVFLRSSAVGFTTAVLPDSEPVIAEAYALAIETVNRTISCVSGLFYTQAVYNLGADLVVNFAPDVDNAPPVTGSELPYFAYLRDKWNILKFVSGTIQSASDEGSSTGLVVPKAAENFTLADLQNLKSPWGRNYLSIAQRYGPSVWGMN